MKTVCNQLQFNPFKKQKTRQRPGLVYYNFEPNNLTVLTICAV